MKPNVRVACAFVGALLLAATASAQFMPRLPEMRGVWSPTVGSGAAYLLESKEGKHEMEIAVVGTETVAGKAGHWLEMVMKDPEQGVVVMKHLVVLDGKDSVVKRMIIQVGDQPPMEFPMEMMMRQQGQQKPQPADFRETAERVGTETITTPAGTFTCEHWRAKDKSGDVWIAEKTGPYGVVKATSRDGNMTLVRLVTNAKTRIRGTPQKFDPAEMMRRPD